MDYPIPAQPPADGPAQDAGAIARTEPPIDHIDTDIDALLADAGIAMLFFDLQLRLVRFTSSAVPLFHFGAADIGRALPQLGVQLQPVQDCLLAGAQAALSTSQPLDCQVQAQSGRWYTMRIRPYHLHGLQLAGVIVSFIDMTETKLAQEALHANERFLRESQQVAGIASYVTDLATGVWKVSPEMYKIFGIDASYPHTLEGWAAFLHPDTRDQLYAYHFEVERERKRFDYEYKVVRINDKAVRWVHGLGELEYDADGNPVRRIGTIQDITERKLAEEELAVAAVAFESQSSMIITTPQGVILRVNSAFTRFTGYTAEEAIGKAPGDLLHSGRHDALFYQRMWDSLRNKGRWQGEIWNRHKNGFVYAALLTIAAVETPDRGVTHYVGSYSDIGDDKEAEAEIHRLAYYDPLTRLPNRRLLQDRLGQAIAASGRSGRYGALFFIDLDNFKALNDTRGHDAGDLLLVEVAQRLAGCVRDCDTVARQGGDEFVVLLDNLSSDVEEAARLAGQLGHKLRETIDRPFSLRGQQYHCKLSIGVALFSHCDTVEGLFKHADLALYQAKNAGRNTLRFFQPALLAALELRNSLEAELHQALIGGQLRLYYQPQVAASGILTGVEALVRWQHPQRGLVLPGEFIPLAEETGWILLIGLWALETACRQLQQWALDERTRHLQIAVNVGPRQFRQSDFVQQVQRALQSSGVNPALLKLELTESLVLEDVEDTIDKMQQIKLLGVRFAMDDFGTGYSSLAYLAQLPLDQLKIDRSFVRNIPGKRNDGTIVRTIITMSQGLEMEVIAEGVETEAQRRFLQTHGCHAYQGYLFSPPLPLPLEALERMLLENGRLGGAAQAG